MANYGKYTDRNPTIRAAGIPTPPVTPLGDCIAEYHPAELFGYHHMYKCKQKAQSVLRMKRDCFHCADPFSNIIAGPDKGRFVQFREDFLENLYSKRAPLGAALRIKSKPDDVTNDNRTFGKKSVHEEPVYDTILPRRSVAEVQREYATWHDKYVISHGHYFPAEQVKRNYNANFDPNQRFGQFTGADVTGLKTKMSLKQCPKHKSVTSAQYDFLARTRNLLGQNHFKYKYEVPLLKRYGIKTPADDCDVRALMEEIDACNKVNPINIGVSYLYKLRHTIHDLPNVSMQDIRANFRLTDVAATGSLPLQTLYAILRLSFIHVNPKKMRIALQHYQLLPADDTTENPLIEWDKFCQLINLNVNLPEVPTLGVIPKNWNTHDTAYRELCRDSLREIKKDRRSQILDCLHEHKDENLETAAAAISPDIPTQYYLEPDDFDEPRTKEVLRQLFSRLVTDGFDELWELAKTTFNPDDDMLSINDLRKVLRKPTKHEDSLGLQLD